MDEDGRETVPCQVLFKLADDLVTRFVCQMVNFKETGVVIKTVIR